ncbi:elongation of very long chain fatty acids protein 4 isoform X1 [Etheostoma spectabile]|uniref:elongation of very long chain fatty acids protein 4 isoform X1 n=1 Tax=Etheostoma spectabile TaxID=54343 RepID=UPI0013AEF3BC|nr:elongation of very long chain fatty acids protein 4-like isoform X1 [Etheostoma spectabile]
MASAWQSVVSIHQRIVDNGDKRTDQWLLVYSPVPVALIFLTYLFLVWAGPRLMKHREALDLKGVLIVYNFAMVGLSGYMFYEFLVTSWLSNYSYLCQPVDYSNSKLAVRMAKACWWFFFSKVIELSDTLFFILRKKNSQLTFLHIYHHGTMIFNWWAGIKYVAGGQSFFIGLVNTFVHIVMYSYYGLAAIGPHMQKYLWWKRYLTSLQLLQFLLFLLHTGYNLFTSIIRATSTRRSRNKMQYSLVSTRGNNMPTALLSKLCYHIIKKIIVPSLGIKYKLPSNYFYKIC